MSSKVIFEQTFKNRIGLNTPIEAKGRSGMSPGNKGRVGNWVEYELGLRLSNSIEPDMGDLEIKTINVRSNGNVVRGMALGVIPGNVENELKKPFEQSHLYNKIKALGLVCFESLERNNMSIKIHKTVVCNIEDHPLLNKIEYEYNLIKRASANGNGIGSVRTDYLKVQPKGSVSHTYWAFYLSVKAVKMLVN